MQLPNSLAELEKANSELSERREASAEWFVTCGVQRLLTLKKEEMEFRLERGRLYFAYWGREGARLWRVTGYETNSDSVTLQAERRFGADKQVITLMPRATAREGKIELATARLDLCARLGQLALAHDESAEIEQINLSQGATPGEPGPYARIALRQRRLRIYATGPVVPLEPSRIDAFLAASLLWFQRKKSDHTQYWLIVPESGAGIVGERLALLREGWREAITLLAHDAAWQTLTLQTVPTLHELLGQAVKTVKLPFTARETDWADALARSYPRAVDVVRSRHGATLRWRGLPFARVRRVLREKRVWFGVDGKRRQILCDKTQGEWDKLIAELHAHRRPDAPDRRHELYRARSEAWLETLLRQDISKLDPGLVIAPLHAQFRALPGAARPIDLLALRQDGRLAVIELKTTEDREHALQAADYWLRVEQQRRRGHLRAARLFGDTEIASEPALVYLVAPLLSFHRDFNTLATMLNPAIEAFRFDLNEDWRKGVRVARRMRVGEKS